MEKEELAETKETSPQAVVKLEEEVFTVQDEDRDTESKDLKTQNIGHDGPRFDTEQDGISDKISSQADERLEGEAFIVWNEDHDKESKELKTQNIGHVGPEFDKEQDGILDKIGSQADEKLEGDAFIVQNEDQNKELKEAKTQNVGHDDPGFDKEQDDISYKICAHASEKLEVDVFMVQNEDQDKESKEAKTQNIGHDGVEVDSKQDYISNNINEVKDEKLNTGDEMKGNVTGESELVRSIEENRDWQCGPQQDNFETSTVSCELSHKVHECDTMKSGIQLNDVGQEHFGDKVDDDGDFESKSLYNNFVQNDLAIEEDDTRSMELSRMYQKTDVTPNEDNNIEPSFDGTEVPGIEVIESTSTHTLDTNPETPRVVEKVVALKNFVREKSIVAVYTILRRLFLKRDECTVNNSDDEDKDDSNLSNGYDSKEVSEKTVESTDVDAKNKTNQREDSINGGPPQPRAMKGRIILYTRLGCQESKEVRQLLYIKRLRYVEISIDVYPSRKMELEKNSGSSSVPKVFFNEILIGGLGELKSLNESGNLDEKIDFLIAEAPSFEAPLPPLSGEDDVSSSGALDEMALIVRKMKESIGVKDRFSKMRRFTNCFLGFEAVDFLLEDQYLERKEMMTQLWHLSVTTFQGG